MLEVQTGDHSFRCILSFDSFSKILSSRICIGFMTGPTPLLDAINQHVSHAHINPHQKNFYLLCSAT
jgi:DNA-binding transcriptional MocR family regulator